MTQIVASLVEKTPSGVADSSRKAFGIGADLVEIRLDHLDSVDSLDGPRAPSGRRNHQLD